VVFCVVFFKLRAVERFGFEVGTESRGHYVRKLGVDGCVKWFAKRVKVVLMRHR
jgi:hypothetical protein